MVKNFGSSFRDVDELYNHVIKEETIGEGREISDIESLKYLQELQDMNGELYVITDFCYEKKCGPFLIDANDIYNFVSNFKTDYGEVFYVTDIVIINFAKKLKWVLFHEGICWLSKG